MSIFSDIKKETAKEKAFRKGYEGEITKEEKQKGKEAAKGLKQKVWGGWY